MTIASRVCAPGLRRRLAGYAGSYGWFAASAGVAALTLLPVVALVILSLGGTAGTWQHVGANVLPAALPGTALLLLGVGITVTAIGCGAAWLVAAYDFPGRKTLDWALLLPLAVPTYVVAFAYVDVLHPLGPVQGVIRALLGVSSPRDFRLPDIRSMLGAIMLFGLVLYPYVYLTTRALFLMQGAGLIEAARVLGAGQLRLFFRVALPLARPAIAMGTSLALMETLNDVGASEFLGIRTLTLSVYSTWINQSDLPGAAGIALVMLAIVLALVLVERRARHNQRYAAAAQRSHIVARKRLTGVAALLAVGGGATPVVLGFVVPALYLAVAAVERVRFAGISATLVRECINTLAISGIATAATLVLGIVVAYAARIDSHLGTGFARMASLGYALPGTVLAVGLLFPLAALDNAVDGLARDVLGVSTGLLIIGSGAALVYAYVARFLAISIGGIEAGLDKVPRSLDQSARTLGRTPSATLAAVHLPLIRPAIGAAAILVFVDCMKELPATLLLRPLNFETLATHLYGEAVRGTYEEGAVAALSIVIAGLLPVILLARVSRSAIRGNGGVSA